MKQIPESLRALTEYRQFILWKPVKQLDGTVTKIPIHFQTGMPVNAHDPVAWLAAPVALEFAKKLNIECGIGFVFTEHDPFFFVDIDKCYDGTNWSPLALDLVERFKGCAVELSQSRSGLHIIGTGELPEHGCKNSQYGLELYHDKRFIALTGLSAYGDASFKPKKAVLNHLVSGYFPPGELSESFDIAWTEKPVEDWNGPKSDNALIKKMLESSSPAAIFGNKASVQDLWNGNVDALSQFYPPLTEGKLFDHSSADEALCSHLAFWTGKDCARIDRLFRQSKLMRDKWEKRFEYYGKRTINRAVSNCKSVYTGGAKTPKKNPETLQPTLKTGNQFMTIDEQLEHFKGCVYIQHEHRAFVPSGHILKPEQFKVTYGGYIFNLDSSNEKTTTNAWEVFTESQVVKFPKVNESCFRPDMPSGSIVQEEGQSLVNTYVPVLTPRQRGDVTPFITLVERLFPDRRDRTIILSYMAAVVQYPGIKFRWTPVIQGTEGNGKSLLAQCVAQCVGNRYTHIVHPNDVGNTFNAWIRGKLFVIANDIYVNDRKDVINAIKPLITDERVPVTPKGVDQMTGDNRANFMCSMNPRDGIRKTRNDRRFCVFFTPQQSPEDVIRDGMNGSFFPDLVKWMKSGGYAIVNDFLHEFVIPEEFNPATLCTVAPDTTSTNEARSVGLGTIEQEVIEAIEDGRQGFANGWLSSMAFARLLEEKRIKLSPNKRKEIMEELGFIPHPGLPNGRVNATIALEGGKPRLYIKKGHIHANFTTGQGAEIVRHYLEAQGIVTANPMAFAKN